jgi:hypothetical protein
MFNKTIWIGLLSLVGLVTTATLRADDWNKKTILTFSGPVQIPGVTLPAGSYVFKLAELPGNRHVIQVFDKEEKKLYTTILAIPNDRVEPSDKPLVLFSERASGSPQAVRVWYYPGERTGNEFVYPKSQAMRIAKETHQRVLAMNNESGATSAAGGIPDSMKTGELGYFDEDGKWQASDQHIAVDNQPTITDQKERLTNIAASTTAQNTSIQPAGTSGSRSERKHLPRTASSLVLFEVLGALSLAGGFAVRRLRQRLA